MRKWVLWGHHLAEYMEMFGLTDHLLKLKILEFASGPTTVNKELNQKGTYIRSYDPWFSTDFEGMQSRFLNHFQEQLKRVEKHPERFDFNKYGGIETFLHKRKQGVEEFFLDYPKGLKEERYCPFSPKKTPFSNSSFDLVLCSNYFFADIPEQDLNFHLQWIQELTRVANEVRIYPLTDQTGQVSQLLGPTLLALQQHSYQVAIEEVPFRLVPNSKAMLRIRSDRCRLSASS